VIQLIACVLREMASKCHTVVTVFLLIKGKPLIYECNEQCRCPLSCRNRVTQRGLDVHLEVFKTSYKRWGVRSSDPIAAGTFISEYTGQVVCRTGSYLSQ
jgi:SET domain-containing protein